MLADRRRERAGVERLPADGGLRVRRGVRAVGDAGRGRRRPCVLGRAELIQPLGTIYGDQGLPLVRQLWLRYVRGSRWAFAPGSFYRMGGRLHARHDNGQVSCNSVKRAVEVYMSPETPKRPDSGRELCSFVHGDHSGYANYLVFDVEDRQLGEFLRGYAQRTIHMETRIPGLTVQTVVGQSIPDAINTAMPQLPR